MRVYARARASLTRLLDPSQQRSVGMGLRLNVVLLLVGFRIGTLAQMLPSLPDAVRSSPRPDLAIVSWTLAVVTGLAFCVVVVRTQRPPGRRIAAVDGAILVVLFLLGGLTVGAEDRVGTWVGFQSGYALCVLTAISSVSRNRQWAITVVVIAALNLQFCLHDTSVSFGTLAGNTLTLVLLPAIVRVGMLYLRRVADLADESIARAADLARREEEARAQAAMHNGAAVMAMLARDDLDERVKVALREQALAETRRMRRYLSGDHLAPLSEPGVAQSVADVVARAADGFADLRIDLLTDLGAHAFVDAATADALSAAVTSVLLNVRTHAQADRVVIHLDADDPEADREPTGYGWTLSVHDDGVGFDAAHSSEGVGLREVVRAEMRRCGIAVQVNSVPGAGTTVVLSGGPDRAMLPASPEENR